ncbi:P-loop containing nucleoside triphosphate hydrolase protein [Halenospora varia]|nr:P-loop containing nucleoside triphosphate hydrolase protein [Halenospora varia]
MIMSQSSIDSHLRMQNVGNKQQALLNLIDKIQEVQLPHIKLPQIVVVGGQSSGKSSVLEAVTGIPFPRDADACTKFATEIRLRRSERPGFRVTIIPDRSGSGEIQEKLRRFGDGVDSNSSLESLLQLARRAITAHSTTFAFRDKLVVERSGPKEPLLTLVDLPGLLATPNNDQTKEDIAVIESLTDGYMKSSRAIILAVVGGNTDYAHATILPKVRQFDPTGSRTIGVLTKPDSASEQGLEDKFLNLVNNRDSENQMQLGWYVLRNPGPNERPTSTTRQDMEAKFFLSGAWGRLPKEICGADALRQKLATQLQRHIARYVPRLRKQVRRDLDSCKAELETLGKAMSSVGEMRQHLTDLLNRATSRAVNAVDGNYRNEAGTSFFPRYVSEEDPPPQNLRARVVKQNQLFSELLRSDGHKLKLTSDESPLAPGKITSEAKKDYAKSEVAKYVPATTGTHFPKDFNHRIPYSLFEEHSTPWKELAGNHLGKVIAICNHFVDKVLEDLWPSHMQEPLRERFLNKLTSDFHQKAEQELNALLRDLSYEVQPYDPEYEKRLTAWCTEAAKANPQIPGYTEPEKVLEKALIFYDLAAKVFIRNIIVQVIERHLMEGVRKLFDSSRATSHTMSDETIKAIASESVETRERRTSLTNQEKKLAEAIQAIDNLPGQFDLQSDRKEDIADSGKSSDEKEDDGRPGREDGEPQLNTWQKKPKGISRTGSGPEALTSSSSPQRPSAHAPEVPQSTSTRTKDSKSTGIEANQDSLSYTFGYQGHAGLSKPDQASVADEDEPEGLYQQRQYTSKKASQPQSIPNQTFAPLPRSSFSSSSRTLLSQPLHSEDFGHVRPDISASLASPSSYSASHGRGFHSDSNQYTISTVGDEKEPRLKRRTAKTSLGSRESLERSP